MSELLSYKKDEQCDDHCCAGCASKAKIVLNKSPNKCECDEEHDHDHHSHGHSHSHEHGHSHEHAHGGELDKNTLLRIGVGILLYIATFFVALETAKLALYVSAYIIIGYPVMIQAVKNIAKGEIFDENFLMMIATLGAFGIKEYPEAVAVMLFYQIGEFFQDYAVSKSKKSIEQLMDIRPDYANLKIGEELIKTNPEKINIGDVIVIKPGERVPLDAEIVFGSSSLDTSALTGESVPRDVSVGDEILSGCINVNGLLEARVSKTYSESTVSKILELVQNASNKKSKSERFITKFARYYTPSVVFIAAVLAFGVPLATGAEFADWISRALIFLVISCPCALVISVPLSFFGGIGGASRRGVLVKGGNYLEMLADTEAVVFDKTGTLTKGVFEVSDILVDKKSGILEAELLEFAAYAESYSNHPIANSIIKAYGKPIDNARISFVEEIAGHGIKAVIDNKQLYVGNLKLMDMLKLKVQNTEGTAVHVALEGNYLGSIVLLDKLKEDAKSIVSELKTVGVSKVAMLTGDSKTVAQQIAEKLSIKEVYSELLPSDKVDKIEQIFSGMSKKGRLAFVGDGINDAPVLARADIGIAMGGLGSDAAIEAADVVIMTDEPSKIVDAIKISKKTIRIAKQNIVFALTVKLIVLTLGALGMANMWAAVFADVGVSLLAVINSMRAMKLD